MRTSLDFTTISLGPIGFNYAHNTHVIRLLPRSLSSRQCVATRHAQCVVTTCPTSTHYAHVTQAGSAAHPVSSAALSCLFSPQWFSSSYNICIYYPHNVMLSKSVCWGEVLGRKDGTPSQPSSPQSKVETEEPDEAFQGFHENQESDDDDDATSSSASHSQGNKSKKLKLQSTLSPEQEQIMVEWLEDHPILYNKKLSSFKDVARKDRLWKEKAAEVGKPVVILKTWYTSLRSRYGRLKKKKSMGDLELVLTEREKWILKVFEFLRPHLHDVQKRTTTVNLKERIAGSGPAADKNRSEDATLGFSSSGSVIQVVPSTSSGSSLITPRVRARRHADVEEAALESIQQRGEQLISLQKKHMVEQMKPSGDREREAFVEWIRTVILDLDHSLWRRFQHRISDLTYQFIAENDKIKTTLH